MSLEYLMTIIGGTLALIVSIISIIKSLVETAKTGMKAAKFAYDTLLEIKDDIKELKHEDAQFNTIVTELQYCNTRNTAVIEMVEKKIELLDLEILEIMNKLKMTRRSRS